MKILHINVHGEILGGTEKYLYDVCSALQELGHQIILVVSSQHKGRNESRWIKYDVPWASGFLPSRLQRYKIMAILQKEKPDIVHIHNTYCYNGGRSFFLHPLVIREIYRLKPTIRFIHDVRPFCLNETKILKDTGEVCTLPMGKACFQHRCCPRNIFRNFPENMVRLLLIFWDQWVNQKLDRIVVGSHYMHQELLRNNYVEQKINVNPCFTKKGAESKDEELSAVHRPILLCVGRFDGAKITGIRLLIESLALIREKDWQAEIVGDGPLLNEAVCLAEKYNLGDRIRFLGHLPPSELDRRYRSSYCVVVPSMLLESFGLVGIEAMAFGKPVVAFNSGGIEEWLKDGETGFLVERGDIEGFADKISRLLEDREFARKMGKKGKERVEKYFGKEIHLKRLLAIYEEAISSRITMTMLS